MRMDPWRRARKRILAKTAAHLLVLRGVPGCRVPKITWRLMGEGGQRVEKSCGLAPSLLCSVPRLLGRTERV